MNKKLIMRKLVLVVCTLSLIATSGCIVAGGHGRRGGGAVIVPAPVVVVPVAPVVRVR